MRNFALTIILVMVLFMFMTGQLLADTFIKQVTHVGAFEMMGQKSPEKFDTSIVWMTEGKACSQVGGNEAVIFDAESKNIYLVNHQKKEYSVVSMNASADNKETSEAQKMMQTMGGSTKITITPTDVTEKIGDWNAKKYDIDMTIMMMNTKQELWATEDIKVNYELFNAVGNGMMAQIPGFDKIFEEMKKIKGLPVKSIMTTTAMGGEIETSVNLIEYAEKEAPAGIYDIPEGYKKVETSMGMGKQ